MFDLVRVKIGESSPISGAEIVLNGPEAAKPMADSPVSLRNSLRLVMYLFFFISQD